MYPIVRLAARRKGGKGISFSVGPRRAARRVPVAPACDCAPPLFGTMLVRDGPLAQGTPGEAKMKATQSSQRLGLALSGGGFRASFYHIGVLARMAEMGMLRHVESISTVSGGSIVGAAYYLLLKRLLESKPDSQIRDEDYVRLIERLESHFLEAVQKNLRMRTFANPWTNLRMLDARYSRSDAIGALYEKHIYRPLLAGGSERIRMSELLIQPSGAARPFHPWDAAAGNPARENKVPVLILNATSLNSGHNWVFTASSMGEVPPRNLNFRDIDKKDRYRRVRYDEITTRDKYFLLGNAVAASAGVPGLFPPMAVSSLYRDRRVQLVDGGVFDNQGISGLLDPDCPCTHFVVSDASGQSDATDNPRTDILSVLTASSGIQGDRVREETVNSLELTQTGRGAYFHLTRGLFAKDVEFNEQGLSSGPGAKMRDGIVGSDTDFAVDQEAQRRLAHIRTDLDSFTDVEAGSLEADAYQMSESRLLRLAAFVAPQRTAGRWTFDRYRAVLRAPGKLALTQLAIARHRFFKPYLYAIRGASSLRASLGLLVVSVPFALSVIAIALLIDWALKTYVGLDLWKILTDREYFQSFMGKAAPAIYALVVAFVLSKIADKVIPGAGDWTGWLQKALKGPMAVISALVLRVVLPPLAAIPVLLYLLVDRYYIRVMGKLD